MRIGLLDPRWVEERDKQITQRATEDAVFAPGQSIESSLKRLAERRTDIFGVGEEAVQEAEIGKKKADGAEEDSAPAAPAVPAKPDAAHTALKEQMAQMRRQRQQQQEEAKAKAAAAAAAAAAARPPPPPVAAPPPRPPVPAPVPQPPVQVIPVAQPPQQFFIPPQVITF